MNETPFFSVVVPAFNRALTIASTLASIQKQTFCDFECIVVDDGSNDGIELQRTVASLRDARFKYVWQPNGGGGAARNLGIRQSTGRYIAFLDSDDRFLAHKLERVHQFLGLSGANAVYSKAFVDRGVAGRLWTRPDRAIGSSEDMGEYLFVANQFVQTSTIVIERGAATLVMFDPELRKGQDLDFCVRAHAAGVRFEMIDEPLVVWVDASEVGRTSRHAGARAPGLWLERMSPMLTVKACRGYRANVLAYYQPKSRALVVLKDILVGVLLAGIPVKVGARQLLRFAMPRTVYRQLANFVVRVRGVQARGAQADSRVTTG